MMKIWPFTRNGASGFSAASTAKQVTEGIDANGLTAVVTGTLLCLFFCFRVELYFFNLRDLNPKDYDLL